jgi:hypothetical protein
MSIVVLSASDWQIARVVAPSIRQWANNALGRIVRLWIVAHAQPRLDRDARWELPDAEPLRAYRSQSRLLGCRQARQIGRHRRVRLASDVVRAARDTSSSNGFTRQAPVQAIANGDDDERVW